MNYVFSDRLKNLEGNAIREIFKMLVAPDMISFAGGFPAAEILPVKDIFDISNEILSSDSATEILQYGASEGYTPFRMTAIEHVKRFDINDIDIDNVTIVSGGQQTIDLTCKAFINKGDAVLVEDPTYLAVLHILKTYQARAYGIKSDENGIDLNDLESKIRKYNPKFIYLVPTFSNPTGRQISIEKRAAIAKLTAKYEVMVLEDDPYSELRFEGERLPAIKSFDKAGNVIFTSSFSKTISPGLRTGICIADKKVTRKLVLGKQATDVHTAHLSQAIVNRYLSKGLLDKNLKKMIPYYLEKKELMLNAIRKYMPQEFIYTNPKGGLFIWGQFNCDIDTSELFNDVAKRKVAYVP
ncbi:MAG: PLP-dependent aminotransferase family protein, partial [Tissierellia bacterium]|nr:PLP-dependent aminotransferase family protein [Tissierellia bacterium]